MAQSTAAADPNTTKSAPRVINVDKNAAYPKAIADLKATGLLPEQVELRLVKPGMGFFSFETAGKTLQGYECMHMIRKGQMHSVAKGDITGQVTFIARLFGVAA